MRVAIVHETDGQKYFAAIDQLKKTNKITSITYIQGRCLRNLGRDILKQDVKPSTALKKFITAWKYRVQFPFTKYDITIIAFGPYDFRFVYYALFSRAKRIITHTSWPEWVENPPVQYGYLTCIFEFLWRLVFRIKNIECIAVTEPAKSSFNHKHPLIKTLVIPHAVGQQFTSASRSKKKENICFVGELSEAKGIHTLIEVAKATTQNITVIGTGPLSNLIKHASTTNRNIKFLGPISDRPKLAEIVSSHKYLIVPSQKNKYWQELFGIVIIEAMAAGTIPICSNHAGPRGILGSQWPNLLIDDESNPNAFLTVIETIDSDEQIAEGLSKALMNESKKYGTAEISEAWHKLIEGK